MLKQGATIAELVAKTDGDEDLVVLARDDLRAFEQLYLAYRLPVYRYLRSRSPSEADAGDLAAITFERAFRGIARYRPQGSPLSWLMRIARNVAVDAARRRRPSVDIDQRTTATELVEPLTPEDIYLAAEHTAQLRLLVQHLPEAQRDAIALRYASGLTAREIGAVIGKYEAATQKLLTRALTILKEAYDVQP